MITRTYALLEVSSTTYGIQHDIANRLLPSLHMKAYEALCRAERIRRGY